MMGWWRSWHWWEKPLLKSWLVEESECGWDGREGKEGGKGGWKRVEKSATNGGSGASKECGSDEGSRGNEKGAGKGEVEGLI